MPGERLDTERLVAAERAIRDREASMYDGYREREPFYRKVADALFWEGLGLAGDHTVLDVGCGTGSHLALLLERAGRVIGVDHSPRSLEVASGRLPESARPRVTLEVGDVRQLPLPDACADRAMCAEVIQHVPSHEHRLQMVRELRRVLVSGGVLAISAYRWRGHVKRGKEGSWDSGLYRYAFTTGEFRALLAQGGFVDVRVGGAVILPTVAERLGVDVQRRLAFTPVGRHLGHYVFAVARRP